MRNVSPLNHGTVLLLLGLMAARSAEAAIALDRTRVVFDGNAKSTTVGISNQNKELPYLAQSWVEDASGKKIDDPIVSLPPLQRLEPGARGQIKIQATGNTAQLPQDKESLFWFNVREIPPKPEKSNTLQIALQTRVKLFYRPPALALKNNGNDVWQKRLTLTRQGNNYVVNNPTGYYVTLSGASAAEKAEDVSGFQPVMIAPGGQALLGGSARSLGTSPVLTFINDWGGRPKLFFTCRGNNCTVSHFKEG